MSAIPSAQTPPVRRSVFAQAAATEATAPTTAARPVLAATKETPTAARSKRPSGRNKDILLSVPEELKDRMEATIANTIPKTGIKHQQVFIRRAIEQLCEQLEVQYNDGEQFELLNKD